MSKLPEFEYLAASMAREMEKLVMQQIAYAGRTISSTVTEPSSEGKSATDVLAEIRAAMKALPPAPPKLHFSRHATAMPTAQPFTDDMRQLVDQLGRQRIPAAFKFIDKQGIENIIVHPDLLRNEAKRHGR